MAKLYIAEFINPLKPAASQMLQLPAVPPAAGQILTYSATAASSAFAASTHYVRLVSDADCHLEFGAGAISATVNSVVKLTAGLPEYFCVTPGHKVAAIAA
jgi:hypothetical protein